MITKTIKISCLILTISSCTSEGFFNGWDSRFDVINQSDQKIYYQISLSYPDTSISFDNPYEPGTSHICLGNSQSTFFIHNSWEAIFELCPSDTLMFFIFDSTTLVTKTWDEIKSNYLILKRYDLSYEDWENKNGDIIFP